MKIRQAGQLVGLTTGGAERGEQISERLLELLDDATADDVAVGVHRGLAGQEDDLASRRRRRARTQRGVASSSGLIRSRLTTASPPSTSIAWPLIEPSAHAFHTAAATSAGRDQPTGGLLRSQDRPGLSFRTPGPLHDPGDRRIRHRRVDVARADRVDRHPGHPARRRRPRPNGPGRGRRACSRCTRRCTAHRSWPASRRSTTIPPAVLARPCPATPAACTGTGR